MEAALVLLGWVIFGGSHVLLASSPIRSRIVARLGRSAFLLIFSIVAWVLFAAMVVVYSTVRTSGPPGLDLGAIPWARTPLVVLVVAGLALVVASVAPGAYVDSVYAQLGAVQPARGLERVTRHPFFAGTVMLMGAHTLLAPHLTGSLFFGGFVVLAVLGPIHQSRKLRALRGATFDAFLRSTSAVPFVAILRGRQRFVASEMPWIALAVGALLAWPLRLVHAHVFDLYGAPFIAPFVIGPMIFELVAVRREARRARAAKAAAHDVPRLDQSE